MPSRSEIEHMGFLSEDIKAFLAVHGIEICGEPEPETKPDASKITDKELSTKERNSLLIIIATLCKEAKIDYTKPSKSGLFIESTAESIGLKIGKTTAANYLREIKKTLVSRTK